MEPMSEILNNYSKDFMVQKIIPLLSHSIYRYLNLYIETDKKNLSKILVEKNYTDAQIQIGNFFDELSNTIYALDNEDINFYEECLKDFKFIKDDIVNNLNSVIQNAIDKLNTSKIVVYNYYNGINCDNNGCHTGEKPDDSIKNMVVQSRIELIISYMKSFSERLNETYDEKEINNLFINSTL
jgi:hypothetical protein